MPETEASIGQPMGEWTITDLKRFNVYLFSDGQKWSIEADAQVAARHPYLDYGPRIIWWGYATDAVTALEAADGV